MAEKSRGIQSYLYPVFLITTVLLLIYTRFINTSWGLPYPFHPDERNMADAIVRLTCSGFNIECFNPHFFAYGQLPLYLGYLIIQVYHSFMGLKTSVSFSEAVLALRFISAISSIATFFILMQTTYLLWGNDGQKKHTFMTITAALIYIFSPALIQFAHFGTTESLLMFFYSALLYCALRYFKQSLSLSRFFTICAVVSGAADATKVSAVTFLFVPVSVILYHFIFVIKGGMSQKLLRSFFAVFQFLTLTVVMGVLLSPYNFISFNEFLSSMHYESAVGLGTLPVFYTRQFEMAVPILFQFFAIFPYALGSILVCLFVLSFYVLPFKKEFNLLRLAFLVIFLSNTFLYTKWTRFMAPAFPVMLLMSVLLISRLYFWLITRLRLQKKIVLSILLMELLIVVLVVLPGVAYLSVYTHKDTRFVASEWIYKHIPADATILSETANVIDLPIIPPYKLATTEKPYKIISFNMYDVDDNLQLAQELKADINKADYIIVPSRRVFANHTCIQDTLLNQLQKHGRCAYLQSRYPILNTYYQDLFSGKLGFKKVAKFKSEPAIWLFNKQRLSFPDETAEETWSVFDHPTVRIFKRI